MGPPRRRRMVCLPREREHHTNLSPEEIHQLGLDQVKEVESKMLAVVNQLGFKDMKSFKAASTPTQNSTPTHARRSSTCTQVRRPDVRPAAAIVRTPAKAKLEVMQVEEFREKEASDAAYVDGTPDGSRPGHIMVNTGDFAKRTVLDIETTAITKACPDITCRFRLRRSCPTCALPPARKLHRLYRRMALYAERLGKEVGFYQDPYSYYGHLQDDMLRAIRLVVDTGFHYKHWTRQQVVDYFHEHSAIDEVTVQSETDRYSAWPAQALGYKIGQLEILRLRQYAKDQLGDKFDIRGFHDEYFPAARFPWMC